MKGQTGFVLLILTWSWQSRLCAQGLQTLNFAKQPRAYYISVRGNDSNSGTGNHPFKTISKVNNLKLVSGDRLYFKGRETFIGTLRLHLIATKNKSIVITIYGIGR